MAYSVVGSLQQTTGTTGQGSVTITPTAIRNAILLIVSVASASITATGVTGGACTWQQVGSSVSDATEATSMTLWIGTATGTSATAATITYSSAIGATTVGRRYLEFTAGLGAGTVWSIDKSGTLDTTTASTTVPLPTLVPTGSGELYFGNAIPNGTASAGSTSGYTYVSASNGSFFIYNLAATGSQSPTCTQTPADVSLASAGLFTASVPATNAPAGNAAGTGTAQSPTPSVAPALAAASGTGSALAPSVTTPGVAAPAAAAGTGTARAPSVATAASPGAGLATGTGSAQTPVGGAGARPAGAAATGSAPTPATTTAASPTVGAAAGTGAARTPTVTLSTSAGIPFLQTTMGPALGGIPRLSIEVSWGADLAADPGTWTWTNISADVLQSDGAQVVITSGRGDEASVAQPASCTLTLDNTAGKYSLGGQSSNWPNVRRNTPVRVRVDTGDGSGYHIAFQGFATAWSPSWDITGRYATVNLTAAGVLRRLGQGKTPVVSSLKRALLQRTDVVAYWPCEDAKGSTQIASALAGGSPMLISGALEQPYPKWEAGNDFLCSDPLPEVALTSWRGVVAPYTGTGQVDVRFLMKAPALLNGTQATILSIYTTGTLARTDLIYEAGFGGLLSVTAYDTTGAVAADTVGLGYNVDNTLRQYNLTLKQVGGDVQIALFALGVGYNLGGGSTVVTATGFTVSAVTAVAVSPGANIDDTVIGHLAVRNAITSFFTEHAQLNANFGELAHVRIARLCAENDVPITVVGTSQVTMGFQPAGTLLALLRECELADRGVLFDGRDAGLTYVCGSQRVNAAAALTVNAAAGELARAFQPVDDDQRNTNKVTATRTNGGSATVEDATGPHGTAEVGIYDTALTVNIDSDLDVIDHAGWAVHLGTQGGYRYPSVQLDLAHKPLLAPALLGVGPSSRVDVINPATVRALPVDDIPLLVEGMTMGIDQFRWDVSLTCSPYAPWRVGQWAATTGDTNPLVLRAAGDGSTLNTAASLGSVSLSVATPSGPLWTTTADDYPFDLDVGGIRVTATACTGSSSPQTFTVTGVTKSLPSGLAVDVWQPTVPGV